MDAPGVARGRRAFLAPVWLTMAGALAVAVVGIGLLRSAATTTIIVIRNAEQQIGTIDDPPLSSEGERRAVRLAQLLGTRPVKTNAAVANDFAAVQIGAVYAAETRRAQQTAAAVTQLLGFPLITFPPGSVSSAIDRALQAQRGRGAVIVGDAQDVQAALAQLSGAPLATVAKPAGFATIYVVTKPRFSPVAVLSLNY